MQERLYHVCFKDDDGDTIYRGRNGAVWSWDKRHAGAWDFDRANELLIAAERHDEDDPEGPHFFWIEEA